MYSVPKKKPGNAWQVQKQGINMVYDKVIANIHLFEENFLDQQVRMCQGQIDEEAMKGVLFALKKKDTELQEQKDNQELNSGAAGGKNRSSTKNYPNQGMLDPKVHKISELEQQVHDLSKEVSELRRKLQEKEVCHQQIQEPKPITLNTRHSQQTKV